MKPKAKLTDPYTGEVFEPKRSNQKFACLANKTAYHNDKAKEERKKIEGPQKALKKNREVLKSLLKDSSEIIVSRDFLLGAGFNFNYYIGSDKNKTILVVYEFEFSGFNNDFKISRRKNYG
jgi:hypothetical protein